MSLLEKLKEEVITDPLLQKQYETEKEIYNIAKCLKKIQKRKKTDTKRHCKQNRFITTDGFQKLNRTMEIHL